MNLRRETSDDVEVNLTPLIDVVFLLLIFFMVSTTFIRQSEISLTLPEASSDVPPEEFERVEVAVDKSGQYFVNGKALVNSKLETLKQGIEDVARNFDDPAIVVSADAEATHQSVITILDAARQLGYVRLTFATEIKDE